MDWNNADPVQAAADLIGEVDTGRDWSVLDEQFKRAHAKAVTVTQPVPSGGMFSQPRVGRNEHGEQIKAEIKRQWLAAASAHRDVRATPSF
ncbi:hypothetical protein ACWKSP_36530 [Micromonosporaceae bacterium Da 78-11]